MLKLRERKTREWQGMVTLFAVHSGGKGHVKEERYLCLVGAGLGVLSYRSLSSNISRLRPTLALARGLRGHRWCKVTAGGEGAALASDLRAS